jgi:hypothetical protein
MYAKGNAKVESIRRVPVEIAAAVIRQRDLIISEADYNLTRRQ